MMNNGKHMRKIGELKNWDKNPRSIKEKDFERLKTQIRDLGQYKPLLITDDGMVLGGNMRLRAYRDLGIDDVWVSVVDAPDEEAKMRYALSDNDRAGFYDEDLLANLTGEYPDFNWEDYAVDLKEPQTLDDLIKSLTPVEEDDVPEVSDEPARSEYGKVYQLGRHRLMCGDVLNVENMNDLINGNLADLVVTDPPYGVSYSDKNKFLNSIARGNKNQTPIENDHKTVEEMGKFWLDAFISIHAGLKDGGSYYIFGPQGGDLAMMMMMIDRAGFLLKQTIIWAKNNHVLGRSDYNYKHEPILYGWKKDATHQFYGGGGKTTIWNFDKPLKSDLHPTMKPISLLCEAIQNSSKEGDIVLDTFGGSGSTLIACEQTNRTCYMSELDRKYVDVIIKRWMKFTGKRAYKIIDAEGNQVYEPVKFADESFMDGKILQESMEAPELESQNTVPKSVGQSEPQS